MDTLRNLFALEIQLLKEKSKVNEIITDVHFLTLLHPNPTQTHLSSGKLKIDRILNQKDVPGKQSNHQHHRTIIIIIIIIISFTAIHVLFSNSIGDL